MLVDGGIRELIPQMYEAHVIEITSPHRSDLIAWIEVALSRVLGEGIRPLPGAVDRQAAALGPLTVQVEDVAWQHWHG